MGKRPPLQIKKTQALHFYWILNSKWSYSIWFCLSKFQSLGCNNPPAPSDLEYPAPATIAGHTNTNHPALSSCYCCSESPSSLGCTGLKTFFLEKLYIFFHKFQVKPLFSCEIFVTEAHFQHCDARCCCNSCSDSGHQHCTITHYNRWEINILSSICANHIDYNIDRCTIALRSCCYFNISLKAPPPIRKYPVVTLSLWR